MNQTLDPTRYKNISRLKSLLVFVLMVCFVLSTCAVRKGIQSFFIEVNTAANSNNAALKINKILSSRAHAELTSFNVTQLCSAIINAADGHTMFKQQSIPVAPSLLVLCAILPCFLLSLWCFKTKSPSEITITDLSVSRVPLFIKNRLLLI